MPRTPKIDLHCSLLCLSGTKVFCAGGGYFSILDCAGTLTTHSCINVYNHHNFRNVVNWPGWCYRHDGIVNFLLEHNADPNIRSSEGVTPLRAAALLGSKVRSGKTVFVVISLSGCQCSGTLGPLTVSLALLCLPNATLSGHCHGTAQGKGRR